MCISLNGKLLKDTDPTQFTAVASVLGCLISLVSPDLPFHFGSLFGHCLTDGLSFYSDFTSLVLTIRNTPISISDVSKLPAESRRAKNSCYQRQHDRRGDGQQKATYVQGKNMVLDRKSIMSKRLRQESDLMSKPWHKVSATGQDVSVMVLSSFLHP